MIPPSDYSQVWMSPHTAIERMWTISERDGVDRARTDGRFKKEREAWAAGVLALALSKLKDDLWWVEVESVDATPDTKLHQISQTANGNVDNFWNIENVDWEEHVDDIMTVIRKKCKRSYPPRLPACSSCPELLQGDQLRPCDRTDEECAVAIP